VKGKSMDTMNARRSNRVAVNVNVDVETVLERHSGRITDLSENGAKVEGQPFAVGQKVKLTAEGAAVWGTCRWAEVDRMGIEFDTPMPEQLQSLLKSKAPANDRRKTFGRKAA
tara:strand:+ start:200 stop:538 length:339 start_codon:yes stop_codon:yes gene_type:complete